MAASAVSIRRCCDKGRALRAACLLIAGLAALSVSGCAGFGTKQPTLKSTTSAEQYERIFRAKVRDHDWKKIAPLLATNVVYAVEGRVLSRDQIVPYLKSRQIGQFVITDMVVKPNGPDMTLSYSLQISSHDHKLQTLIAISVWQQVKSGWILIAHSEQPQASPSSPAR